jgi:hypothetical protein
LLFRAVVEYGVRFELLGTGRSEGLAEAVRCVAVKEEQKKLRLASEICALDAELEGI